MCMGPHRETPPLEVRFNHCILHASNVTADYKHTTPSLLHLLHVESLLIKLVTSDLLHLITYLLQLLLLVKLVKLIKLIKLIILVKLVKLIKLVITSYYYLLNLLHLITY